MLPCEHRFLSDVAFNVYEVVGVAWQSCSCCCCCFFFFTPRMGLVVGTLRRRQTTEWQCSLLMFLFYNFERKFSFHTYRKWQAIYCRKLRGYTSEFFSEYSGTGEETDKSAIVFVRSFILLWKGVTLLVAQSICLTIYVQPLLFWLLLIVTFQPIWF